MKQVAEPLLPFVTEFLRGNFTSRGIGEHARWSVLVGKHQIEGSQFRRRMRLRILLEGQRTSVDVQLTWKVSKEVRDFLRNSTIVMLHLLVGFRLVVSIENVVRYQDHADAKE